MLLAIDTATRWLGLALYDGRTVVAEVGWRSANTQTVELAPAVADLLGKAGLEPADLVGVAVAIGPGSYTGLRIGLGLAKGLALANQMPLIGVATLDILVTALAEMPGLLIVVAEAGRSRVCAATYKWQTGRGWQVREEAAILTWEDLLGRTDEPATFAGEISPAAAKLIRAAGKELRQVSAADGVRRAGYLAELGWKRLRRGRTDDPAALTPIYLRDPAGN